jgi:hypothetical protein
MLSEMAVAALDLQRAEGRERRARLVAVSPPYPGPSIPDLLERWCSSWQAALAALDAAARIGALTSAEVAAGKREIHAEQELIRGELQVLGKRVEGGVTR